MHLWNKQKVSRYNVSPISFKQTIVPKITIENFNHLYFGFVRKIEIKIMEELRREFKWTRSTYVFLPFERVMCFFVLNSTLQDRIFTIANVVPSQICNCFPQKQSVPDPQIKRHRNSLLVGLQRSPLSGPSSFLVSFYFQTDNSPINLKGLRFS